MVDAGIGRGAVSRRGPPGWAVAPVNTVQPCPVRATSYPAPTHVRPGALVPFRHPPGEQTQVPHVSVAVTARSTCPASGAHIGSRRQIRPHVLDAQPGRRAPSPQRRRTLPGRHRHQQNPSRNTALRSALHLPWPARLTSDPVDAGDGGELISPRRVSDRADTALRQTPDTIDERHPGTRRLQPPPPMSVSVIRAWLGDGVAREGCVKPVPGRSSWFASLGVGAIGAGVEQAQRSDEGIW